MLFKEIIFICFDIKTNAILPNLLVNICYMYMLATYKETLILRTLASVHQMNPT